MTNYLLDTSVVKRADKPKVRARLEDLGPTRARVCLPVLLEVGVSARNGEQHAQWMEWLHQAYGVVWSSPWAQERAVQIQGLLAERGQHRSARLSDLIVAATAEQAGLTVLHYDRDFELIASVTGQLSEWIVPAGTADG